MKDHKTLGLRWDTSEDTFRFTLRNRDRNIESLTKRQLLSIVMSLFDPLGLVLPQAVVGRLIQREIWRLDYEWDTIIPEEMQLPWRNWVSQLVALEELRIPRWCGVLDEKREMHIFVEASDRAMAAAAYVRGIGVKVSLAAARCKLAPTSQQSIPRLELQAAVLGVWLAESMR